jgi:2-amino-4-hydroxy-6-hydroxymethyldihydropteridine diphosphokinase
MEMKRDDPDGRSWCAYVALGSNLGDRLAYLQLAVDALAAAPGVHLAGVSRVYETVPVGGPAQNPYLNAVVALDTNLDPHALWHRCQQIETMAARERIERWGPRTLDVDVLLVDDWHIDGPDLTLPHPRMWQRGFVLAPLRDVAPQLVAADRSWIGVRDAGVTLSVPPLA